MERATVDLVPERYGRPRFLDPYCLERLGYLCVVQVTPPSDVKDVKHVLNVAVAEQLDLCVQR